MHSPQLKALVILVVIEALISTLGILPILQYAFTHKSLPTIAGIIKALSGPFEALGLNTLIVAGLVFVAASSLKFLAAYWLWNLRMDGAVLQLILLGVSSIFWYGFAVPYGPLLGIPQVILIALAWGSFK
ncbi:MAG: hypothetical protein EPO32_07010 [Anaerolineae bacterium]|nr:MAG: hypothetical protein EPO32_07010 [Anaerolineae bacterium]